MARTVIALFLRDQLAAMWFLLPIDYVAEYSPCQQQSLCLANFHQVGTRD